MRRQYHLRRRGDAFDAWDVDKLVAASRDLPVRKLALSAIRELDETYWYQGNEDRPTCRSVIAHMRLVQDADLVHPIIIDAEQRVMDGMHRVAKALLEGRAEIACVQIEPTPPPDFTGVQPDELDY